MSTLDVRSPLDVRMFTVGPVQENAYIVRPSGGPRAVMIDPGEEAERLLGAVGALGVELEAILITHCHFDHIGAVAPVARATGAPVWCPEIERPILADIMRWVPWDGFGPFESYEADRTLAGGEVLELAGMRFEVLFTPGHSPGHLTYAVTPPDAPATSPSDVHGRGATGGGGSSGGAASEGGSSEGETSEGMPSGGVTPILFSGDVLFEGSVGRTDLPGADWGTLERSIGELLARCPADSTVYPGHMGVTTLGRELASNPFLAELRASRRSGAPADAPAGAAAASANMPSGGAGAS